MKVNFKSILLSSRNLRIEADLKSSKTAVIPKEPNRMIPHQKSETKSSETRKRKIDF